MKDKAPNNRTLTVSEDEIPMLRSFITTQEQFVEGYRDDMIVNGNLFECMESIPDKHFSLAIIDPPYNLDKDFNGKKFSKMGSDEYEDYLRSWFYPICDKLTDDGGKLTFTYVVDVNSGLIGTFDIDIQLKIR